MIFSKQIYISLYCLLFTGFMFFSAEINTIIQFICLAVYLIMSKRAINRNFLKLVLPLFLIFILGVVSFLVVNNDLYVLLKDMWYFSRPILLILCGYLFVKDLKLLLTVLISFGLLSCLVHFVYIAINYDHLLDFNLYLFRAHTGHSSFIEILSFVILFFNKRFKVISNPILRSILLLILSCSLFLYFSRSVFVVLLIFYFFLKGYHKFRLKSIFFWLTSICLIVISIFLLNTNDLSKGGFAEKVKNSINEIGIGNEFNSTSNKIQNWRAYEAYLAFDQSWNKDNYTKLMGRGFGSLVDLKRSYNLGGDEIRYIPYIHNGFVNILFKTGLLGALVYCYFLFRIVIVGKKASVISNQESIDIQRLIFGMAIYYMFTTLVTGGIYNTGDYSIFFLGSFIFLFIKSNKISCR